MKLSIVIPVYQVEGTLNRCVESVISQTFADYEIILVDDGSPDKCPQMCDEWSHRDKRIKVIHQPNSGLSDARNAGIDIAQGDYITFVDSDDFIGPDTYLPLMTLLEKRPEIDILEFPIYWHYGSEEQQFIDYGEKDYIDMTDYWLKGYAYEHTYMWNKIFRRDLFMMERFASKQIFEDVDILPRLLQHAKCVTTTRQGLYLYCLNSQGITANAKEEELCMLLEGHLKVMENKHILNDNRYYMHVLNIQIDVCKLTGVSPRLKHVFVNPFTTGLTLKDRIKSLILNTIGITLLCKLHAATHKARKRHS